MPFRTLSNLPLGLTLGMALALGGLAWWLVRRESVNLSGPRTWLLPTLRGSAIALIAFTLAEPAWESTQRRGTPGRVVVLLDNSQSMSLNDSLSSSGQVAERPHHRFARATAMLGDKTNGWIEQLQPRFDIQILTSGLDGAPVQWQGSPSALPSWVPEPWTDSTRLGVALQRVAEQASQREATTVCVLLSDGQNNAGRPLTTSAQECASLGLPVFAVGYGLPEATADIRLKSAQTATRFYREDTLTGSLVVDERLEAGSPYRAEVLVAGKVLWGQQLNAIPSSEREIEFAFPVADLLSAVSLEQPPDVRFSDLAVRLDARLTRENETHIANNQRPLFTRITAQQARILLIDGSSRWETRYLRNMFTRDPAWELVTVLDHPGRPQPSQSQAADQLLAGLPNSPEALAQFNLVILGDIRASAMSPEFLQWLRAYVEAGQGGLILVDGARAHLASEQYQALRGMVPVRWTGDSPAGEFLPERTQAGMRLEALRLDTASTSQERWAQLPALRFAAATTSLPGAEVLAVARTDTESRPLVVTRQFGAGRILYLSSDETWRWRYKTADKIHTRLWNQLARWTMRRPLSVQSDFLALDTGPPSYALGDAVEVLCDLRDGAGMPAAGSSPTAVLRAEGTIVARLPLAEMADYPGRYRGSTTNLPAGNYEVQIEATGFPAAALAPTSQFSVLAPVNLEFQDTACNESLLRSVCEQTGGEYFHEQQASQLVAKLQPLSGGEIHTSAALIWQSYGWFATAILLLTAEWILRKRAGLI